MPTIYEYFGIIFKFYSSEHEPVHVHVMHDGGEAVFEIIMENGKLSEIRQRSQKGKPLSEKDVKTARAFVEKYAYHIIEKWINFFVYKKTVRRTVITKKL